MTRPLLPVVDAAHNVSPVTALAQAILYILNAQARAANQNGFDRAHRYASRRPNGAK